MKDQADLPPRPPEYTPEEWAAYHRDPCAWCIKELRNPDPSIRCTAADILRGLAWDAERAIPALIEGLRDPEFQVRAYCTHALAEIGFAVKDRASIAVPALTELLRDGEAEVRSLAAFALGCIGHAATSALPALRELLNNPDEESRERASVAITKIGG